MVEVFFEEVQDLIYILLILFGLLFLMLIDYMKKFKVFIDIESVVGMIVLVLIKKGEQVLESKLIKLGLIIGLFLQVLLSKCAIVMLINEVNVVVKMFNLGDCIDIVVVLDVGKGVNQCREVKILM